MKISIFIAVWLAWIFPAEGGYPTDPVKKQKLVHQEKGFITCAGGGTGAPLFQQECKELTLSRVTTGGAIRYEGSCLDNNEKNFLLACDSFVFERPANKNARRRGEGIN